ncbi:MAG: response regulator [Rickettsiales bacterium]
MQTEYCPDAAPIAEILIVDDRPENLFATRHALKSLGARILTAESGNAALSLMLRHKFAAVLLDVQMPEMDGFEVAGAMRAHDDMRDIPIIFVTAIDKEERHATMAGKLGAVDYVFKPINTAILRSKVKTYLEIFSQKQQVLRLNAILRQSNEELERFAYICSHDMQEPVRMMYSYAKMAQESLGDPSGGAADAGEYLEHIVDNAGRMRDMIRDILAFSRIGREEIHMQTVDCDAVMRETTERFAGLIDASRALILCGKLPKLYASLTLVRMLFQNLVGNALKFQARGVSPRIAVAAAKCGGQYWFFFSDNGVGLDAAFKEKIFRPFARLHRRDLYPGTGIGLSACRKFLRLCGGEIGVESSPPGSVFYFTLPITETSDDK